MPVLENKDLKEQVSILHASTILFLNPDPGFSIAAQKVNWIFRVWGLQWGPSTSCLALNPLHTRSIHRAKTDKNVCQRHLGLLGKQNTLAGEPLIYRQACCAACSDCNTGLGSWLGDKHKDRHWIPRTHLQRWERATVACNPGAWKAEPRTPGQTGYPMSVSCGSSERLCHNI